MFFMGLFQIPNFFLAYIEIKLRCKNHMGNGTHYCRFCPRPRWTSALQQQTCRFCCDAGSAELPPVCHAILEDFDPKCTIIFCNRNAISCLDRRFAFYKPETTDLHSTQCTVKCLISGMSIAGWLFVLSIPQYGLHLKSYLHVPHVL